MSVVKDSDNPNEKLERKLFEEGHAVPSPAEIEAQQSHEAAKIAMEKYRAKLMKVSKEYGQLYVIASKYGEESLLEHAYGIWQILMYVECVTGEMTAKTQAEAHEHIGKYISDKFVALWPVDEKTKKPVASFINAVRGDLMAYEMRSGKATVTLMEVYHNSPKVFTQDVAFAISLANRLTITAGRLHRERMLEINPEIQN
jgi:uroporphyrinogen-III synthase